MSEQRYQAVLAVIAEGYTVTEVAARFGVSRQTMQAWLAKYEGGGLEGLEDGSHRPPSCPHQMGADVEVALAEMRTEVDPNRGGSLRPPTSRQFSRRNITSAG